MSEGSERHEFRAQVGLLMNITISNKHSIDPTSTYPEDSDFQLERIDVEFTKSTEVPAPRARWSRASRDILD